MVKVIKNFNIINLLIVTLIFASCKRVEGDVEFYDKISFACDSIETKASGFTEGGSNPLLSLGVFAAATSNVWDANAPLNLMSGVEVKRPDASSPWAYSDEKYWPGSGLVSFFAYAPYTVNGLSVSASTGVPVISLTTPNVHINQQDLLVAAPVLDQTKSSSTGGRISFQMKHALSRISFAAKISQAQTEQVRITQVSLLNLYNKGTCSMSSGNLNWIVNNTPNTTPQLLRVDNDGIKNQVLTTDFESITSDKGYLFYIPQTVNSQAEVEIKYSLNNVEQTETVKFKLADVLSQWQAGEAIRFLINLDLNNPFNVKLGYSFEPWGNSAVDVPIDANPYLYVSDVNAKVYDGAVTRVYFYSNQPAANVFVDPDARETSINGTAVKVADKFMDIVAGDNNAKNFVYNYDPATKSGKGYIDFVNVIGKFVDGSTTTLIKPAGDQTPVLVRLRAGKLDYYINLIPHITSYVAKTSALLSRPPFGQTFYTAAFHKRSEVGERIITFYLPNNFTWTSSIQAIGDGSDLVLDRLPSPDHAANLLYGPTPRDAEGSVVSDWTTNIGPSGTRAIKGRGRVYFRIGWKKPATTVNKYAIITIGYIDPTDPGRTIEIYIYCRQGEEPDHLEKATDDMFSPFNLVGDGILGKYPSQGGFLSQWGRPRQWPLVGSDTPVGYPNTIEPELDRDVAICPEGYTYPDKVTLDKYKSKNAISAPDGIENLSIRSGFCADGYFDRRYEDANRVEPSSVNNASIGVIWFIQGQARSLFLPTPGYRDAAGKLKLNQYNMEAFYWSSIASTANTNNAFAFGFRSTNPLSGEYDKRMSALVRCVKLVDPGVLKYDPNGGENVPRSSTVKKDAASKYIAYIPKKIPNNYWRPGYFFFSWKTDKNGAGVDFFPGTDYTMAQQNVTLFANWSQYYRVDFTKLLTQAMQTQYLTTTSYIGVAGSNITGGPFSGLAGINDAATKEKAFQKIEFHETIQVAKNWSDANNFCNTLVDAKRAGAQWRLPRMLELMLVSQLTPVTAWGQSELFGGDSQPMWSATKMDANNAYQATFYNSSAMSKATTASITFRCVREF